MTWIKLSEEQPPKDTWCWVIIKGCYFPALWNGNRFVNSDTWEDFFNEVTHWYLINVPLIPQELLT